MARPRSIESARQRVRAILERLAVGTSTVIAHQPETACDRKRGDCTTLSHVRKYAKETGAPFESEHLDSWSGLVVVKRTAERS